MNVVVSSAWLSYFAGDNNAKHFAKPIENLQKLLVPGITLTEVFKCVLRQASEDLALDCVAHMEQGNVIPLDSALAIEAAHLGVLHKLPLADSIIYATAQRNQAVVWTQDSDFASLQDVRYFSKT